MKNNLGLPVRVGQRYRFEYLYDNLDHVVFIGEVICFDSFLPNETVGIKVIQDIIGRAKDYFKLSEMSVIYNQNLQIRDRFDQCCYTYLEGQDKPICY